MLNYPNFSSTLVASIMKSVLLGRSDRLPINREPHGFRKSGGDCAGRITQAAERE
jgi:hypothetical protein